MVASLLKIIISEAFITQLLALVGTLIIALILFALYNSSSIIRKKTRAEAIQKLKLDSMIEIINGTEEFRKAITETNIIIIKLVEAIVDKLLKKDNLSEMEILYLIIEKEKEFMKSNQSYQESTGVMDKFIFSLHRDMIINEEDIAIREEIKKIMNVYEEMTSFTNNLDKKELIARKGSDLVFYVWNNHSKIAAKNRMRKSIETLWKMYKEKLDKEQEDWLDKLLNYPRKIKIMLKGK